MHWKAKILSFAKNKKLIFLLLTVLAGILTLWPLHDFQAYVDQGDHGRDLYCFKKTLDGAVPYRDYSWLFGPLMPYYYGLFYRLFGISIQSVLLGQNLLILLTGTVVYLLCSVFLSPPLSFACALWYWAFRGVEFFYTYNHTGGIAVLLFVLYLLLKYIKEPKSLYAFAGFLCLFLLTMIRLNMGIACLAAFAACLCLTDTLKQDPRRAEKRRIYIYASEIVLLAAAAFYWFLLRPLPAYVWGQTFPYSSYHRTDVTATPFAALRLLGSILAKNFTATGTRKILAILLAASFLRVAYLFRRGKIPTDTGVNLRLIFSSLAIFLALALHEFIASGVFYRIYWAVPIFFVLIFFLFSATIETGAKKIFTPLVRNLVLLTLLAPAFFEIRNQHFTVNFFKTPAHLLRI
ncbi:MAG: hypothetical protein WC552_05100, partial [Candidatus Omnitrophota bacterium]